MTRMESVTSNKIVRPRYGNVFYRKRLSDLYEQATAPVVWIAAPAGYGKTVSVSTYLSKSHRTALWYRIDQWDADPGNFFHYIRNAAISSLGEKANALPTMLPEHNSFLGLFARRFFEQLAELCAQDMVLVLDDLHCLGDDSQLIELLSQVTGNLPATLRLFVLSRRKPPVSMSRFLAYQQILLVDEMLLRLTPEELNELANNIGPNLTTHTLEQINQLSQGWITAASLMLRLDGVDSQNANPPSRDLLFDFLITEVFNHVPGPLQEFMLQVSFLDILHPECIKDIAAVEDTEGALAEMVALQLFTYESQADQRSYTFHPLFHAFLKTEATRQFGKASCDLLKIRIINSLYQHQYIDEAIHKAIEFGQWQQLCQILLEHAADVFQQGRQLSLLSWLQRIPKEELQNHTWLQFWLASCLKFINPAQAKDIFENTLHTFRKTHDQAGFHAAWSGFAECIFYLWEDFSDIDPWLERPSDEKTLFIDPNNPDPSILGTLFTVLAYRKPDHPACTPLTDAVYTFALSDFDNNARLVIASSLAHFLVGLCRPARGKSLVDALLPLCERDDVLPSVKCVFYAMACYTYIFNNDLDKASELSERALNIANSHGVMLWAGNALAGQVYISLIRNDKKQAKHYLKTLQGLVNTGNGLHKCHYYYLSAMAHYFNDEFNSAISEAEIAHTLAVKQGVPLIRALTLAVIARAAVKSDQLELGQKALSEARRLGDEANSDYLKIMTMHISAQLSLKTGDEESLRRELNDAYHLMKIHNVNNMDWWHASDMAELCAQALQRDIETEFVTELVRSRNMTLRQPPVLLSQWPWKVKIYALGRLNILRNDIAVSEKALGQSRPIELLGCLLALGGRSIGVERIQELLWPDLDGADAQNIFSTTLHRLRKILGGGDILILKSHQLGLNQENVWCDVWHLQRLLSIVSEQMFETADSNGSHERLQQITRSLLAINVDDFLKEFEEPWVFNDRERIRLRYLRGMRQLSEYWESLAEWHMVAKICDRVLTNYPQADSFSTTLDLALANIRTRKNELSPA